MSIRPDEQRLEEPLLRELVSELDGWSSDGTKIEKTFTLNGFTAAVKLVNAVAEAANAADHHPDIHLEDYKKVRIVLTTHAVKGLSRSDIDLAKRIDALAGASGGIRS